MTRSISARSRRVLVGIGVILVAGLGYLLLWPVPIDPVPFDPPPAPPLTGPYAPNEALSRAERLAEGQVLGPEDGAVDPTGRIYVGTHDGKIVRTDPDGTNAEVFAATGGRPLGLTWDREGNLIVADAKKGLLSVAPDGAVALLTDRADGVPFRFTDDVDVAADGRIYFSDASDTFGYGDHMYDLLEARPHGRLLRYDPETKRTEVLARDVHFANGIAVSKDDRFVLVNETYRFRVLRHWLEGAKAGQTEVFIDNLPGYPDGVSRSPRGTFWVALFTVRNETADSLAPQPLMKKVIARLPRFFWPTPEPYGLVLELDESGKPIRSLHDPTGERIETITSVEEVDGALYLGTLHEPYFGRLVL